MVMTVEACAAVAAGRYVRLGWETCTLGSLLRDTVSLTYSACRAGIVPFFVPRDTDLEASHWARQQCAVEANYLGRKYDTAIWKV
jgi:hypothetical protein